jgi:metallo-beta-lactamase family protein
MTTRIRMLGGASTVTGSKFLMTGTDGSLLIDCGLLQGPRRLRIRNWEDPFRTTGLPDQVMLTHAHIDHTGWLPRLAGTLGFTGPVHATAATASLLGIMLPDAAGLQEEEAAYANRKSYSRHQPALPLYTRADAEQAIRLLRPHRYHEWLEVAPGRARFSLAGHILGSSFITVEVQDRRLVFSGDVGRWDVPILRDPEPPPPADLLFLESTYGDRTHAVGAGIAEQIATVIDRLIVREGVMVVPAFSIGRTQEILYRLRHMEDSGRIPRLPVFLDSPMAISATEVYSQHDEEHDLDMQALDAAGAGPLQPDRLQVTRTVESSKRLNRIDGPAVIISASGMATGGLVVHHLKRRLPQRRDMVVFVGYQAAGTRGRSLVDGASRVKIHGEWVPVRAEVTRLDAFSAHADREELIRWVTSGDELPGRIALVHGEPEGRRALAEVLRDRLGVKVLVPRQGDTLTV